MADHAGRTLRAVRRSGGLFALPDGVTGRLPDEAEEPACFADLQLDQLVDVVVAGRGRDDLVPAFRARLSDPEAIERRLSVFADLADGRLLGAVRVFGDGLARCRRQIARAEASRRPPQSQWWRLDAVATYVDAVDAVTAALEEAPPTSPALLGWRAWLQDYRVDPQFRSMADGARDLLAELSSLRYALLVSGNTVTASPLAGQEDLGAAISATFARFGDQDVPTRDVDLRIGAEIDLVHAAVLGMVGELFPDLFRRVTAFLDAHGDAGTSAVDLVDRELQFALTWLDFTGPLRTAGLPFCSPHVRPTGRLDLEGTFDVLLAHELVASGRSPVVNDVALGGEEQVLVVTGPNQGGKTTLARTVGQLHHLASLGLPVPGRSVALRPPDVILTHLGRGDRAGDLTSRLEDEVLRVRELLARAGPRSLVILNEVFASTTWVDALRMSSDVLRAALDAGATTVCVTFVDELSTMDPRVVSLVAGIDRRDPARRTFSVARARADGKAHARALATEHGLTSEQLRARIRARA